MPFESAEFLLFLLLTLTAFWPLAPLGRPAAITPAGSRHEDDPVQSSFHGLFAKIASSGHRARGCRASAAMIVSAMSTA